MDKVWRRYLLGLLLALALLAPIGYLIFQIFPLLGYADPADAPDILKTAVMFVFVVIMLVIFALTTGDTYNELQRRRLDKKKRGK